jgi:hypothetical protein
MATEPIPNGFFAYPSTPYALTEAVKAAIEVINRTSAANIKSWEDCKIGGKIIIEEICHTIDNSELFCADLTHLNPNVMFELGYAIAKNRRIWLILDTSITDTKKNFEQLQILTTTGYCSYCNSEDIIKGFAKDAPYTDIRSTVFEKIIQPHLNTKSKDNLFYLRSKHYTEASLRIQKRIDEFERKTGNSSIIDDPSETNINPLSWYGINAYSCIGLVCHLTNTSREGHLLANSRHSFTAGMAFGFGKNILILSEKTLTSPIDYRDLTFSYEKSSDAIGRLNNWLVDIEEQISNKKRLIQASQIERQAARDLKELNFGEFVAENEADHIKYDYFVETAIYRDVLEGRHTIVVGRKGAGKSACLIKVSSNLSADKRNIVCIIKPVSYELSGIVQLIKNYNQKDIKGYAIESLWKFIIYSEIAKQIYERISSRQSFAIERHEQDLVAFVENNKFLILEEFAVRLERCVSSLLSRDIEGSTEGSRLAISEALHSNILNDMRDVIVEALSEERKLVILVDNLDKSWDKQSDILFLSEFLLGLLSASDRVQTDLKKKIANSGSDIQVNLTVFLRSDIFYKIMESAREPDKIRNIKITWDDPDILFRLLDERYNSMQNGKSIIGELWSKYFCQSVYGVPIKEYIANQILPRPRDLIFLANAALNTAINRGHGMVREEDFRNAEKLYSEYAIDSILVENGISLTELEHILYEFAGCQSILTIDQIEAFYLKAGMPPEMFQKVTDRLCSLSFLGMEVAQNQFRFSDDQHEHKKNLVLSRKFCENSNAPTRFQIHKCFRPYLEVTG